MALIRQRTQFTKLLPGTLNVLIDNPRTEIRADHFVSIQENTWRGESVTFQRCRLSCNGIRIRVLLMRTSRNYWGHGILEFMAEHQLRDLFSVNDEDEIEIEFFVSGAEAMAKTMKAEPDNARQG